MMPSLAEHVSYTVQRVRRPLLLAVSRRCTGTSYELRVKRLSVSAKDSALAPFEAVGSAMRRSDRRH